jgi:hypothetical protein
MKTGSVLVLSGLVLGGRAKARKRNEKEGRGARMDFAFDSDF